MAIKKKPRRRARRSPLSAFSAEGFELALEALGDWFSGLWQTLRSQRPAQLFVVVFVLALAARLMQPDWYGNRTFHPDERWLFDKTAELHVIDTNAGFPYIGEPGRTDGAGLQYGSLPLYTASVFKDALGLFKVDAYRASILCGRAVTGLVDSATVLLTFLLGWALLGAWPALLAATLLAAAPLNIQLAHFFTVDPWMACFAVAVLYGATRVSQTRHWGWSAATGLAYAAALACKSSGLPLVLPIVLGHAWPVLEPGLKVSERRQRGIHALIGAAIAGGVTLAGFACFMPYAFLHWSKFVQNQTAQQGILVKGEPGGVPYVRQYWDTGIGFHLRNLAQFYYGPPVGLLALLALPCLGFVGVRKGIAAWMPAAKAVKGAPAPATPLGLWHQAWLPVVLLSWALPYYLIVGTSFAKFARYMLPLMPVLALSLAWALQQITARWPKAGKVLAGLLVFCALGWGVGYTATYFRPHPWVETSQWTLAKIPRSTPDAAAPGGQRMTSTMNEDWGDDLPVDVGNGNAGSYLGLKGHADQVNIVEWDSPNKLDRFGNTLSQADVLFLADPRAYGTYLRLPTRFPLTFAYYDLLFHKPESLGFKRVHEASNPIRFFGFGPALADSRTPDVPKSLWADESFTLYDRPHAFVFQRDHAITKQEAQDVLTAHVAELGLSDHWRQGNGPEQLQAESLGLPAGGSAGVEPRINPNFGTSRGSQIRLGDPVLAWWLLVCVMGWLALPLTTRLFSRFPAGGYALSKALGVFLFAWLSYNLAWLLPRLLPFHQSTLWLLLAVLCLASLAAFRRHKAAALAWVFENRSEILWSEAIFAVAFLFFVLVRAYNPNIHDINGQGYFGGGEPLGMTYLSAVMRASTFPLYDPWLALRDSSYYYFGYVIAGSIAKLAGFQASISYNLALALFFSLGLLTAYGVLRGLVSRRGLALSGALLVAFSGSLWSVAYIAIQSSRGTFPLAAWISHGFIWDPTRYPELINGHILEFPYFSYLYSDLHPHNMVVAFSLLLVGLLLAPFKSAQGGWRSLGSTKPLAWAWIAVAGLLLDAQYAINTWSWAVYVILSLAALLIGPWAGKKLGLWPGLRAAAWGFGAFACMAVIGRVAMVGFRHYYLQDGSDRLPQAVNPNEWQMSAYIPMAFYLPGLVGLAYAAGRRLADLGPGLSKLSAWDRFRRRGWFTAAVESPLHWMDKSPWTFWPSVACLAVVLFLFACVDAYYGGGGATWLRLNLVVHNFALDVGAVTCFGLGIGLACLAFFVARGWMDGGEAFVWLLGGFCMFLVWGSEQYYVVDRTNTLFKFWFNGWILMGLVAAAAFAPAFEQVGPSPARKNAKLPGRRTRAGRALAWAARIQTLLPWIVGAALFVAVFVAASLDAGLMGRGWRFALSFLFFGLILLAMMVIGSLQAKAWARPAAQGVFGALLALGLVYPVGATLARIRDSSGFTHPHLDGLAFMAEREARPQSDAHDYDADDAAIIHWLNTEPAADRTETLVEAPGLQMYQGYSRYAIYTGLPTLLGWDYQVSQQLGNRTGGTLEQRKRDAQIIYGADEAAAVALLKQYHVGWIVVARLERLTYPGPGLDKFSHIAKEVFRSHDSVLYRFDAGQP